MNELFVNIYSVMTIAEGEIYICFTPIIIREWFFFTIDFCLYLLYLPIYYLFVYTIVVIISYFLYVGTVCMCSFVFLTMV